MGGAWGERHRGHILALYKMEQGDYVNFAITALLEILDLSNKHILECGTSQAAPYNTRSTTLRHSAVICKTKTAVCPSVPSLSEFVKGQC